MIRYLIDTDISSYFLKKRYPSLDRRMRAALMANAVAISAITRAELRYGQALLPSDAAKRHALIDAFIAEAPVIDWGSRAADRYGAVAADLRRRGVPIGCMDTKIAAHALAEGLILVTNNADDFGRVPGLTLENWIEAAAGV
ncbi:type II toxin-antitoxin system VapC family toxin [Thiocapsa roseopersicina]|uniref:Ribonuclease VapC n=1 Tax=Thiocapsa roseopersicina TaxID=1058 RepID=A0A1H2U1A1_THIRO|nr:type II toxin-antitoxin system VapC family toxin [Thiocapsa roseopersicina]SDW49329.1 tRNA(fMet)-specific endonuclease VapC [Thiocapsa roseopersicina]